MNSEHGIVVVWIMLRVGFICSHYCCRWRKKKQHWTWHLFEQLSVKEKSLKQVECKLGISWLTERVPLIIHRRALGTLNILNSKWTVAMNFIKKIPFHFNISWNCQNKWSGFHGHRAAEQVLPLFQHLMGAGGSSSCLRHHILQWLPLWMVSKSPWEWGLSHREGKCVHVLCSVVRDGVFHKADI